MKTYKNIDIIVSIESRKGGVGKTTAALCLSNLLRRDGYRVLFLDLDITGTNAADIAESLYWKNYLNIIREPAKQINDSLSNTPPINLIELFDHKFMTGKAIPQFTTKEATDNYLHIEFDKVNVIGSQIYNTSGEKNKETCIDRPGVLFDDLHAFWLLDFVKQIAIEFARIASISKSDKVAIILDNSPGYVGLAPAIHEWLTDLGPDIGKFLTVTSLDTQDLLACGKAINVLHKLYEKKWLTSRMFIDASKTGKEINIGKNQEEFFIRLATSISVNSELEDPLSFYKSSNQISTKRQNESKNGNIYCDNPIKYIAAIINRVPRAVKKGHLKYDTTKLVKSGGTLLNLLDNNNENKINRDMMVVYDEYIENQFLSGLYQRRQRNSERQSHRLLDSLEMAEKELKTEINKNINESFKSNYKDLEYYKQLKSNIERANNIVSRACSAVDRTEFGQLSRLIQGEWLPASIVPEFRSALSAILRESELPYLDIMPFEYDMDFNDFEINESVKEFSRHIMKELSIGEIEKKNEQTMTMFADILSMLVCLAVPELLHHTQFKNEIDGLFAGVLSIELKNWTKKRIKQSNKYSIQYFLAQESLSQVEIDEEKIMHNRFFRHMMGEDAASFSEFYKACTSAQARLIDYAADSRFLIQLLHYMVKSKKENK